MSVQAGSFGGTEGLRAHGLLGVLEEAKAVVGHAATSTASVLRDIEDLPPAPDGDALANLLAEVRHSLSQAALMLADDCACLSEAATLYRHRVTEPSARH